MAWTAADIPPQDGRRIVVTGANSGIGLETTRELARQGATVVMACRDRDRGEAAASEIRAALPDATLAVETCDLASLESIRAFAEGQTEPIDVLINNAGTMAIERQETADGFETQFGVNHLGHFALTGRLLPRLQDAATETGDGRVVTVSSGLHERGELEFDDLHGEDSYDRWQAYADSKLANVLFARELERRCRAGELSIRSVAVHPGYADTQLQYRGVDGRGRWLKLAARKLMNGLLAQSASKGALPTLYAATAPEIDGGGYYGPGGALSMRGPPERQRPSDAALDTESAERLWNVSSDLTSVSYGLPSPPSATPAEPTPQS